MAKNMTPTELEAHINKVRKGGVRWSELLESSFFPEDLMMKYINKVFANKSYTLERASQVLEMYKRNNHVISTETFLALCNQYRGICEADGIDDIFDIVAFNDSITDEDFEAQKDSYMSPARLILSYVQSKPKNLSASMMERAFYKKNSNLPIYSWTKDVYDRIPVEAKNVIRNKYPLESVNESTHYCGMYFNLYSTKEVLSIIEFKRLAYTLSGNTNVSLDVVDRRSIRDEIKDSTELMDIFIDKVLNTDSKSIIEDSRLSDFVKHMIYEHDRKDEVLLHCTPLDERIKNIPSADVDWKNVDSELQDMSLEERAAWFSRPDVPVWFLNANAGVLLHLQMQEQNQALKEQNFFLNAMSTVPLMSHRSFFE